MAMLPMRRNPLTSMLDFAAERNREAASLGDVISQIAKPALRGMGVQTEEAQPAVMRGPAPTARPLGATTGPAMAPTLVQDTGVGQDFMSRLIKQESGGNPNAVSPKGATGLTQVMPSTAVDPGYGVPSIFDLADEQGVDYGSRTEAEAARLLFDPDLNLQFGTLYANAMSDRFGGDPALTAAAYNAGPGAVEEYGGVPPFAETQGYVRNVAGGGGDTRLGGGAGGDRLGGGGGNVEDILAQLYPEMSPADAQKARRKDFFAAASQGLSALSQGRPQDFSNIRQAQEQRRAQAVQDMRERERARAAASLVYSQTNDPALATGIATGAISYGDVLSERQMRRANELADQQRIRDAESAEAVAAAMGRTGLYNEEDIAAVASGKMTADQVGSVYEQGRLAEELRADAETKQEVAAQNVIDAQTVLSAAAPGSIEARAAERVIALGGGENVYDIIKARTPASADTKVLGPNERLVSGTGEIIATGITPPGGAEGEVADIAKANMLFEGGAVNPATNQPFASPAEALSAIQFYKAPAAAGAGTMTLQYEPTGGFTATVGPQQAPGAAATNVLDVAKPEPGTATVVVNGELTAIPVQGSVEYARAVTALSAEKQALQQSIATAPSAEAEAAAKAKLAQVDADLAAMTAPVTAAQAETDLATARQTLAEKIAQAPEGLEKAQLENEQLALEIQELKNRRDVDEATRAAQLESLQADAQKKQLEVDTLAEDSARLSSAQYANASRAFAVFETAGKDVLRDADNAWTTGTLGNIAMALLPDNFATERSSFLEAAKQMGSQAMLTALEEAKAAGVTLTPVSNLDVGALGASQSRLSNPERLTGEDIRKETVFQLNFSKDALLGPKDLTRVDEFGNTYRTTADTLGLTEDTFARHWKELPPEVAAAWRNGDLATLPTDDPQYSEAAETLNKYISNWEVYQGDLNRAKVGVLPPPPNPEDAEIWPDIWLNLSVAERAAYRKKMQKEGK